MLATGTTVDGKYEVTRLIGVGGFGAVYEARQAQFDRRVALKLINTTLLMEADGLARFEREAKTLDLLKHKSIVACYGYGVWDRAPYMVMEYVDGLSLERIILADKKLEYTRALNITKQVLEALSSAHTAGIVHRDLKPSNIMIAKDGSVKIIDFGLVKLMPGYGIPGQKLTETGYAVGSCLYMAPEQAMGEQIDARADIYAVGAILYQMLTGKPPFDGDQNVSIMFQHLNSTPEPLSNFMPASAPVAALSVLIDNCMAKERTSRYLNCADVIEDIDAILNGQYSKISPLGTRQMKAIHQRSRSKNAVPIAIAITAVVTETATWFGAQYMLSKTNSSAGTYTDPALQADSTYLRHIARMGFDTRYTKLDELSKIDARDSRTPYLNDYDRFVLYTALANVYARQYTAGGANSTWTGRSKSAAFANAATTILAKLPDTEEAMAASVIADSFRDLSEYGKAHHVMELMAARKNTQVRYRGECMLVTAELGAMLQDPKAFERAVNFNKLALAEPVTDLHLAKYHRALIEFLQGDLKKAEALYEEVREREEETGCAAGIARIALIRGDFNRAKEEAQRAIDISLGPGSGDRMLAGELLRVAALRANGDYAQADKQLADVVANKNDMLTEVAVLEVIDFRFARETRKGKAPQVVPIPQAKR